MEKVTKCANCSGNHPTTYKGCLAHQKAETTRTKALTYAKAAATKSAPAKTGTKEEMETLKLMMALVISIS